MTKFLLLRHAQPDYEKPSQWKTLGWGADLAPLSAEGKTQAIDVTAEVKTWSPEIVLCSPTTRTLQTALILQEQLSAPFEVEFDLHEWVPDMRFRWKTADDVRASMDDLEECKGEWPQGKEKCWEPLSSVRRRALAVFSRYLAHQRVLVVCHSVVIRALSGKADTQFVETVVFELQHD